MRKQMVRSGILLVVVSLLVGCSATQFFYNRADWFIERAVSDYVDLSADQQARVDDIIQGWVAWHRRDELPRYHRVLETLRQQLDGDFSAQHYDALIRESEVIWGRTRERVLADAIPVLASLSDKQVVQVLARLDEKQREYYKKYVAMPDKERIRQRNESVVDQLDRWLGLATADQKRQVAEWAGRAADSYPIWYRMRERRQHAFADLLERRHDSDFASGLTRLLAEDERFINDWEQRQLAQNRRVTRALMLSVEQSLTPKQREHLLAELREISEDIRNLMDES